MRNAESWSARAVLFAAFLLSALLAGCGSGGGQDPILGIGNIAVVLAPGASAAAPLPGATGVAINTKVISVAFNKPIDPATLTAASFTLACPVGTPIAGAVGFLASSNTATFTIPAATTLPANTVCTVTVTTAVRDTTGVPLPTDFVSTFTTGATADAIPPTVSSTVPVLNATGVAVNSSLIANFSEPMDPSTITAANFTLACPAATPITGTVTYSVNGNAATFRPVNNLPASTICTATVTTGVRDVAGNAMAAPFTWNFTTGASADSTAPTVSSTIPAANATGVARNTPVSANFSEAMDPATISNANFTLACPAGTPISGTVTYAVNGNVATFRPASALPASTVCTATISTGVRDVAGNAMANPFTWSFTTGAASDVTAPTVTSTNPANLAVGVCTNKTINATFSEAMDPLTITTATFTLAQTVGGAQVAGVVAYDALTRIATFDPVVNLTGTPATNFTATIVGGANGVKDVAGNPLAANNVTTFTTNASTCTTAPVLGAAAPFGGFGGSATVTNDGLNTVINGDIGASAASSSITGLRDSGGNVYTITPTNNGLVNGLIHTLTAPPGSVAGAVVTAARANALVAFNSISPAALPGGIDVSSLAQCPSCGGAGEGPGRLAGRTLPPGVYLSTIGTYDIGGLGAVQKILTLDAGGDANAVFVFQTAAGTGTLTVGLTGPATPAVPVQVLLINGAQSKNVFWFVPSGATIGTGATMAGTLLADGSITMSTTGGGPPPSAVTTTLNGRAIVLTAGFTMTNSVINVPAP